VAVFPIYLKFVVLTVLCSGSWNERLGNLVVLFQSKLAREAEGVTLYGRCNFFMTSSVLRTWDGAVYNAICILADAVGPMQIY
jgi:hypothetical protein